MPVNLKLLPKLIRPLPKSYIDPRNRGKSIRTTIYSIKRSRIAEIWLQEEKRETILFIIGPENMENTSNNGQPLIITQITTATSKVNSHPQEAKTFSLEPLSPQEKKLHNKSPHTIIEEEK